MVSAPWSGIYLTPVGYLDRGASFGNGVTPGTN